MCSALRGLTHGCKLTHWGVTHGGHVSDVTLYTTSRRLLRVSLCLFALSCHLRNAFNCHVGNALTSHVGDVTSMRLRTRKLPILHQIDAVFAENCTNFVQIPGVIPIQSEAENLPSDHKKRGSTPIGASSCRNECYPYSRTLSLRRRSQRVEQSFTLKALLSCGEWPRNQSPSALARGECSEGNHASAEAGGGSPRAEPPTAVHIAVTMVSKSGLSGIQVMAPVLLLQFNNGWGG